MGAIELVANRHTKEAFLPLQRIPYTIMLAAHECGLVIRPLGNVLYFIPALTITYDEIDSMIDLAIGAIKKVVYA